MNNSLLCVLTLFSLLIFSCKKDDDKPQTPVALKDSVLVNNLNIPWEILWGPDDHIWVTERIGKISRLNPATGAFTPVFTVPGVKDYGEGGLLGMVLHPNFNTTPHVFVVYDYDDGGTYKEKVVRYTYNGTTFTDPMPIIENIPAAAIHNGSRLVITDQKLFISTGDASNPSNAQKTTSLSGKVLRLNLDGSIPADNPDPSSPIWSRGHRNPQGLVFANGILYNAEHGEDTDDEVNIIEKGRNYGWPDVRGLCNTEGEQTYCTDNNIKESIAQWTPTLAVSGLDYYNHDEIPQWKNSLLVATLKNSALIQLKLNAEHNAVEESNEFFKSAHGRMRDICISPQGRVYVCTSNGGNQDVIIEVRAN